MSDHWIVASAILPLAFGASWLVTGLVRTYALRKQLMDVPNARSSHERPTPRGGGVAIVAVFLVCLLILGATAILSWRSVGALMGAGTLVAAVGFADDHGHIPARWRLLAHFIAAGWLVWLLTSGSGIRDLLPHLHPMLTNTLLVIAVVWLLNLYNFMDGIDGIAGAEAVSTCLLGSAMLSISGHPEAVPLPASLAVASLGFLVWNFPRARIFMGDAGSGFVGLTLAGILLWSTQFGPHVAAAWGVLLAAFVADASVTLLRRLLRGERVWEAHRSHLYQRLSRHLGSHVHVTLLYSAVNLFWLGPISMLVGSGAMPGWMGISLAYLTLVIVAWKMGAGLPDEVPVRSTPVVR